MFKSAVVESAILETVVSYYDSPCASWGRVTSRRLLGPDVSWPIDEARRVLIYLWYQRTALRYADIARLLDRDPSTILRIHRYFVADLAGGNPRPALWLADIEALLDERLKEAKSNSGAANTSPGGDSLSDPVARGYSSGPRSACEGGKVLAFSTVRADHHQVVERSFEGREWGSTAASAHEGQGELVEQREEGAATNSAPE